MNKDMKPAATGVARVVRAKGSGVYAGFYKGQRIKVKQTFTLDKPEDFSPRWMVDCPPGTPDDMAQAISNRPTVPTRTSAATARRGRDLATSTDPSDSVI